MKIKYSFEIEEIDHCYKDCPIATENKFLGEAVCMLDENIECSDIMVPVECPLVRIK